MPSRLRTNCESSACLASRMFLNLFNSLLVMTASPVSFFLVFVFQTIVCLLLFQLGYAPHRIRREVLRKGSNLKIRLVSPLGVGWNVCRSAGRTAEVRIRLRQPAASPSPPKKDFSHHTITVRHTQAILLPASGPCFLLPFVPRYRDLIGFLTQNHYGAVKLARLPRPQEFAPNRQSMFQTCPASISFTATDVYCPFGR